MARERRSVPAFDRTFLRRRARRSRASAAASSAARPTGLLPHPARSSTQASPTGRRFAGLEVAIPTHGGARDRRLRRVHGARTACAEIALSDEPDDRIAHAFQRAELPAEVVGDLRALVEEVHTPLAVRSSSLLEDALYRPFAGVYETKMIPNNQPDADTRFRTPGRGDQVRLRLHLLPRARKDYIRATDQRSEDEKMAVIIQEVVGRRHGDRFYPDVSGVARSYNFYPTGARAPARTAWSTWPSAWARRSSTAGVCWTLLAGPPARRPPFASAARPAATARRPRFWAVNMGTPAGVRPDRARPSTWCEADAGGRRATTARLRHVASTYDAGSRPPFDPGIGGDGPRVLDFAPLLVLEAAAAQRRSCATLLAACERAGWAARSRSSSP